MKTSCFIFTLLASTLVGVQAQVAGSGADNTASQDALPLPTAYSVVANDANSRIWERTVYEQGPNGTVVPRKHRYTELATGLNYLSNGQWTKSKEEIDILPQGGAAATQGQHQVYFPGNIYQGMIQMVTADGKQLQSRPLGISYDDGTNIAMIAELTNSIGVLVRSNQVVYPNAFTDFEADLVCTYRKSGFECDLVFHEQPPAPEAYGLNSRSTRLQLLTEFINTPEPEQTVTPPSTRDGLQDTTLQFGVTTFGRGKTFMVGSTAQATNDVSVYKSWIHLQGRAFLVEEVPYPRVQPSLESLPVPVATAFPAASMLHKASATRLLPPSRLVQKGGTNTVQLARADAVPRRGVVLDYVTLNSNQTNYTFQADTTYYITGQFAISGTTVIEGGTVIKYDQSGTAEIDVGAVNCQTASYRPAIFTAKDDNTVGETISGSSGSPSGYYANNALFVDANSNATLSHLRFSYCNCALYYVSDISTTVTVTARDIQIVNGTQAYFIASPTSNLIFYLYNGLIANLSSGCFGGALWSGGAQNLTAVNCYFAGDGGYNCQGFTVSNSILVNIPDHLDDYIGVSGGYNVFYNSVSNSSYCLGGRVAFNPCYIATNWPFQTVGAGSYYLTNNSPYRDIGANSLDAGLLADLRQMTTYPPIVYSNITISTATTFSPQAQRDTDTPDLGYHYDPIDYFFGGVTAYSNVTFTAGTAFGWFELPGSGGPGYGIALNNDIFATFNGTATAPCVFARYDTVQEGGDGLWKDKGWLGGMENGGSDDPSNPAGLTATFTHFSHLAGDPNLFRDGTSGQAIVIQAKHCEIYGSAGGYNILAGYTNCLFYRAGFGIGTAGAYPYQKYINCTFYGGTLYFGHWESSYYGDGPPYWYSYIHDCAFDNTTFSIDHPFGSNTNYADYNYNAFDSGAAQPPTEGTNTIVVTNGFNWQSSWFGNFYLPSGNPLIDKGDRTSDQIGLYHFTTQTNQVVETNSTVDIGYHYVATDAYGNPLDTNGDGIPDYLEDANGNGLVDSGEIGWNIFGDPGLSVIITRPRNGTNLP
jgi:hypothetical protein